MRGIYVVATTFILVFFSMLSRREVLADDCRRILIYESPNPGQSPPAIFDDCHNPAPGFKAEPPIPINSPKPPSLTLPTSPIIASPESPQLETPKPPIEIPGDSRNIIIEKKIRKLIPIPRPVEPKPSADLPKPFPSSPYPGPEWKPTSPPSPPPPEPAIAEPPTLYSKSPQTVQSIPYTEAVERVKSVGVIDAYRPQQQKEIVEEKGTSAYEVQGTKQEKVLGIIPITIAKTVIVSTSDGNIISVRTSIFQKLLDFISF